MAYQYRNRQLQLSQKIFREILLPPPREYLYTLLDILVLHIRAQ